MPSSGTSQAPCQTTSQRSPRKLQAKDEEEPAARRRARTPAGNRAGSSTRVLGPTRRDRRHPVGLWSVTEGWSAGWPLASGAAPLNLQPQQPRRGGSTRAWGSSDLGARGVARPSGVDRRRLCRIDGGRHCLVSDDGDAPQDPRRVLDPRLEILRCAARSWGSTLSAAPALRPGPWRARPPQPPRPPRLPRRIWRAPKPASSRARPPLGSQPVGHSLPAGDRRSPPAHIVIQRPVSVNGAWAPLMSTR